MQLEFWHERWKLNQIGFHQDAINAHLQSYWHKVKLAEGGRVYAKGPRNNN